MTGAPERRTPN
jgi:hypothetical protein